MKLRRKVSGYSAIQGRNSLPGASSIFTCLLLLTFISGCTAPRAARQPGPANSPSPERFEIDEAGGTLTLDNGTSLTVPPGALRVGPNPDAGWIQVRSVVVASSQEAFPFTGPIQGTIYEVSFDNAEPLAPLQVSFPLPAGVSPEEYEIAVYGYDPRHPILDDPVLGVSAPALWSPLPSAISGRQVTAWIDSPAWLGIGWTWKGGHTILGAHLDETYPGGDLLYDAHGQVCVSRHAFQNRPSVQVETRVTILMDRSDGLGQAFDAPFLDEALADATRPATIPRPQDPEILFQCIPEAFRFRIPLHQYTRPRDRQVSLYTRIETELVGAQTQTRWHGQSPAYPVTLDLPGRLDVIPTRATPTAPLLITGSAFIPGEPVDLWWELGDARAPVPIPVRADTDGHFILALTTPEDAPATNRVRLVSRGQTSGWTSEATVQVIRPSSFPQSGAGFPIESSRCLRLTPIGGEESRPVVLPTGLENGSFTLLYEVEDRCGRSDPGLWEIFPSTSALWFDGSVTPSPFRSISVDPEGKLVVQLDPRQIPAGNYKKVIGLRYPGQIAYSMTFLQVHVIDTPYLLPPGWEEIRQVVYRWGKNNVVRGECTGIRTTHASGDPSSRWVTEVVTTAWEEECARNNDTHTNLIDRLTGLEISTTCINCFPRHLGPQPAEAQALVDGRPVDVFTRQWPWYGRQEAMRGGGFWENEGTFQVQYDAVTGIYLDLTYQGKLYFTGGTDQHAYHGQWDSQQVTLIHTTYPYGQRPVPQPPSNCLQEVPNVQGRNAWEAGVLLRQAGYGFAWNSVDLRGTVVYQAPPAGACSPPGREIVRLSLSR